MKESYYLIERFSPESRQEILKEQLSNLENLIHADSASLKLNLESYIKLLEGYDEYELLITSLIELAKETNRVSTKKDLLNTALNYAQLFASWATSGGEGYARMSTVNEIKASLSLLN